MLGAQSNGTMWPSVGVLRDAVGEPSDHDDDEEEAADELETPQNLKLLRIGEFLLCGRI